MCENLLRNSRLPVDLVIKKKAIIYPAERKSISMPLIHLTTFIEAPVERVFDLCRNIQLHKESMKQHKEEAVGGTRFGLIEKDETVTWKANHFFKTRVLRIKITEMQKPVRFVDEQSQGSFKEMKHEHFFKSCENGTIMIDMF